MTNTSRTCCCSPSGDRLWVVRACGCPCPFYIVAEPGNAVYPELNADPDYDWRANPIWAIEPFSYEGDNVCIEVIRPATKADSYGSFPESFTFVARVTTCADVACELPYPCWSPLSSAATTCLPIGHDLVGECKDFTIAYLRSMTVQGHYERVTDITYANGDKWYTRWYTDFQLSLVAVLGLNDVVLHTDCTDFQAVHGAEVHATGQGPCTLISDPYDYVGEVSFKGCSELGSGAGIDTSGLFLTPGDSWGWGGLTYLRAGWWSWVNPAGPGECAGSHRLVQSRACRDAFFCDTWNDGSGSSGTMCVRNRGFGTYESRFDEAWNLAAITGNGSNVRRQSVTYDGCCAPIAFMQQGGSGLVVPNRQVVSATKAIRVGSDPRQAMTKEANWPGGCCG
jgi:hypothetical protein